jgi:peptide/nickel transport system substrate-binding protein
VLTGPRDLDRSRREIAAAGYQGERVALLSPTDLAPIEALSEVAADLLKKLGMNVDFQATDWGSVVQRRAKRDPVDKGGWSAFCTSFAGSEMLDPASHVALRANGARAWFGWPESPRIEALRDAWFAAPDLAAQQRICADLQRQAFIDVPYIPLGQYFQATAYRDDLQGVLKGLPIFWNVHRA